MKKLSLLKGVRVLLALLFFIPILIFFVDFTGLLPDKVHVLLHLQILPTFLGSIWIVVIAQLIIALIVGRLYCSTVCPAGVLQDIINRIYCIGKKKSKGTHRFKYHRPMNLLRYVILALTLFSAIAGILNIALLLDPYSNFGRIATNLFRPIVMWTNNGVAEILMSMDNYSLYQVTISTVTTAGLISGLAALALFIGLTIWRGRVFCNSICPVGALLSLFSRYSLFRISVNKESCIHCGLCERSCKAEAIDSKNMRIDTSRCVDCFNCLSSCSNGSLQYTFNPVFLKKETEQAVPNTENEKQKSSRRTFLATGATVVASLPIVPALADGKRMRRRGKKWPPVTPPGSLSLERFKDLCTGCHLCVTQCPSQVLKPAGLEYGFDYLLKPHMSYDNSYCNYECTVCADVCPTHALKPISVEEKTTTQVGVAHFFINRCIVHTENTDCGACSEHCPTQAVKMVPYKGTLTIPEVNPDLCVGCGGCESICPVRPMRAIIIKANEVHKHVEKPKQEEIKEIEVTDFGF